MGSGTNEVDYAAFVGLDWGDETHSVALQAAGCSEVEMFTIKQTPDDLHSWFIKLQEKFGGRPVAVAIEQTKGAVIHALLSYRFVHVYRINPLSLANYRKALSVSGAKDDPTDAEFLLDWVRLHRVKIKPWVPDDPKTRALQRLVEFRRQVVSQRVQITNRLTQTLKEYFPCALEWAGDLSSVMACDFLSKWETLEKLKKARPDTIRSFYLRHGCRRTELIEERVKSIRAARALTEDSAVIETSVVIVRTLVMTLRALLKSLEQIDGDIQLRFLAHPDREIFSSFPGAGAVLAPRLQAAMGADRTRFFSAHEIQQYSGIAPVTDRSGKHVWIHRRFACPKFLRQTFHEFSGQSIKWSAWARAYYDMQRNKGMKHHAAVRALAYKWIRIIYHCWRNHVVYDEAIHLQSLKRNGSVVLEFIELAA